jgi:hypothetical protein
MGLVEINDVVIWAKSVYEYPALRARIIEAPPETIIPLEIDGVIGNWIKMNDGRDGRPTNGIKPTKTTKKPWGEIRKQKWGTLVSVRLLG